MPYHHPAAIEDDKTPYACISKRVWHSRRRLVTNWPVICQLISNRAPRVQSIRLPYRKTLQRDASAVCFSHCDTFRSGHHDYITARYNTHLYIALTFSFDLEGWSSCNTGTISKADAHHRSTLSGPIRRVWTFIATTHKGYTYHWHPEGLWQSNSWGDWAPNHRLPCRLRHTHRAHHPSHRTPSSIVMLN